MSQYPPLANPRIRQQRHRPSTSSSSNTHTLVNNPTTAGEGRKSRHRPGPSSFSVASTLVERGAGHQGSAPAHPLALSISQTTQQHHSSKSGSSSSKGREDTAIRPPTRVALKGPALQPQPQTFLDTSSSKVSPTSPAPAPQTRNARSERSCCGVVQESTARARERRYGPSAGTKPQPWIVLKLMVGVTLGLMGYSVYVYVGLLVVPMLQRKEGAEGSRPTGIGLLVGFAILWLWTLWAYCKVIFTPPGFARDHVSKVEPPSNFGPPHPFALRSPSNGLTLTIPDPERGNPSHHRIAGPSYEDMRGLFADSNVIRPSGVNRTTSTATVKSFSMSVDSGNGSSRVGIRYGAGEMANGMSVEHRPDGSDSESDADGDGNDGEGNRSQASISLQNVLRDSGEGNGQLVNALPVIQPKFGSRRLRRQSGPAKAPASSGNGGGLLKWIFCCCCCMSPSESRSRPRTYISRRPPTTPMLDPLHRYCEKDGLVKPYRAHHCRSCGTCVLKYDHHCPWIGQCVGARNHKFFLNFCQAAFLCSVYLIATLLPYTIKGFSRPKVAVNPQQLVIIALAALFALFTYALVMSHTYMILLGQTTVENMYLGSIKAREQEQLAKAFKWWELGGKGRMLQEWDREWGELNTEGHIWWIGPRKREWEAVMGKNPIGWILPIGKSEGDGLDYPVNPRFDRDGRWRRREDWPEELR